MREMYPLNVGLGPGAEPLGVANPLKTPGGWVRDQHLTITEVFFGGSAIRDVRLALQQKP